MALQVPRSMDIVKLPPHSIAPDVDSAFVDPTEVAHSVHQLLADVHETNIGTAHAGT